MDEAYAPLLSMLLEDDGLFPGLPVRYDLANLLYTGSRSARRWALL